MFQNPAEYLNSLKAQGGFSWQDLADGTGIPSSTLRKTFSGEIDRPSFETVSKLVTFMGGDLSTLLQGSPIPPTGDDPMNTLNAIAAAYEGRIADLKESHAAHIASLLRTNKFLSLALAALVAVIVFVLVWDITHPTMGYIQY